MTKLSLGLVLALGLGCARESIPPPQLVVVPRPISAPQPPPPPIAAPFVPATLVASTAPVYAVGAVRVERTLSVGPGVAVRAEWENPRRLVVEDGRHRFWLIDPSTDRAIAEIAEPDYFYRLSANELVVRHGARGAAREAVVDIATGAEIAPSPILPIADPIERLYVLHDQHERSDAFLLAIAGGRTFVGPWNDRALAPRLAYEIPSSQGWTPYRRDDGLELSIYPLDPKCRARWLRRDGAPGCLRLSRFDDRHDYAVTGAWELELVPVDEDRAQLVAREHGVEQRIDLPCGQPWFVHVALHHPQALVTCYPLETAADPRLSVTAWTPGGVFAMRVTERKRDGLSGGLNEEARVVALSSLHSYKAVTEQWLDLRAGTVLAGPPLHDLGGNDGTRVLATSGEGAARMAVIVDAEARTVHTAGALPCPGELDARAPVPDLTIVTCGIQDKSGLYRFTWRWSKVFDMRRGRVYDLPGYPEAMFADRTVILSNRTRYAAETMNRGGRLTVATLD
jgi:hypothetical protein